MPAQSNGSTQPDRSDELGFTPRAATWAPQPPPLSELQASAPTSAPSPAPAPAPGQPFLPPETPAPARHRRSFRVGKVGDLGRYRRLGIAVALLLLVFTAYQSWSLSDRVAELDERLQAATTDLESANARVATIQDRSLDAGHVAEMAAPAVFTIDAGGSLGTGFGFYTDGEVTYVATNHHVVAQVGQRGQVEIRQGEQHWTGVVEAVDRTSDVALIRVNEGLPVLLSAYGQGHEPVLGDPVLAYGSPAGLEGTATEGIISAVRPGWIQTDAQINPGNSGGPLLNSYGEVLGLTTIGINGGGSGLGFAITIREVCALAGDRAC